MLRSPAAILAAGWCAFAVVAYPGMMAEDSFAALAGARAGSPGDLFAALWWVLDRIVVGPFPLLAIQSLAFLGGAYLIARRLVTPRAAAACATGVLLLPPVAAGMSIVSSHALVVGLALLGAGLLAGDRPTSMGAAQARPPAAVVDLYRHDARRTIAIAILALATALRPNAFAATVPLLAIVLVPQLRGSPARRYAIVAAIGLAMFCAGQLVQRGFGAPATADVTVEIGFGDTALPVVTRDTQSLERLHAADIQSAHGWLQGATGHALDELSRSIVFWPWVYFVLALALLVRARHVEEVRALLASGIALELSLAVIAPSADWRESLWLISVTLLATVLAVAMRWHRRA